MNMYAVIQQWGLTLLQRCNRCILHPQPTGQFLFGGRSTFRGCLMINDKTKFLMENINHLNILMVIMTICLFFLFDDRSTFIDCLMTMISL